MYTAEDVKRAIESARQVALANYNDLPGYLSPEEFYEKTLIHAVAEHNREANGLPPLAGEYGLQRRAAYVQQPLPPQEGP